MKINNDARVRQNKFRILGAIGIALAWVVTAGATNVYVVPPGTLGAAPDGLFQTWATASTNIQTALNAINITGGNTVFVSNGVYVLTSELSVTKGVYLRSWSDGITDRTNTIVDGGNYEGRATSNRCITINQAQAVVDGFTFRNGIASYGGGVLLSHGLLTNCLVISNTDTGRSFGGGGICVNGNASIVTHCDILYNKAVRFGGGVGVASTAAGEINNCLIAFNETTDIASLLGGGGYMSAASDAFVCRNSVIRQNTSAANGGGVLLRNSGALVENCDISDNYQSSTSSSRSGSGVTIIGAGTVRNCLIAGNRHTSAHAQRAAVQLVDFTNVVGVIENCTIVSNTSRGVSFDVFYKAPGAAGLIQNSIIYDNIGANHANPANTTFNNCCTTPLPDNGDDNITLAPLFVNPATTNYQLQGTSPCIDAGVNLPWMDTARDLAGQRRLDAFAHVVDMGCYEFQPSGMTLIIR